MNWPIVLNAGICVLFLLQASPFALTPEWLAHATAAAEQRRGPQVLDVMAAREARGGRRSPMGDVDEARGKGPDPFRVSVVPTRPYKADVQPMAIMTRGGASRDLSQGAFFFRLSDFSQLPTTIICVGRERNFNLRIYPEDMERK